VQNGLKNIHTVFRGKEANVQCGVLVKLGGCSCLGCDSLQSRGTLPKFEFVGRDSSVDIASRYGLDGPGIESRWDEIFRTCLDRP